MQALKAKQADISHWSDLWFKHKKTGYVAVTDFKKQYFYGANDINRLIEDTKGKKGQYISLNAFNVDWENKIFSRESKNVKQIRNIAIDIDQYNLGLTIDDVMDELNYMILSKRLPEPNLVLTSRGVQIFYTIAGGASPKMSWLSKLITDQFIEKTHHIGADGNASDISRVMRVPNSVNERNNSIVEPSIWYDKAYTLQELQTYCRPLEKFETRSQIQNNILHLPRNKKLLLYYRVNNARLADLERLVTLRKGDFTHKRNEFLYTYSYHKALTVNTQKGLLAMVGDVFRDVYSTVDKPFTKREFETTVKSAYKDAREFFNHFKANGYNVIYKPNDGIKKPRKTENIIKALEITEDEQRNLKTLVNPTIKREYEAERKRAERRKQGMKPMSVYNAKRKADKEDKLHRLKQLLKDNPKMTKTKIAKHLEINKSHLYRLLKEL